MLPSADSWTVSTFSIVQSSVRAPNGIHAKLCGRSRVPKSMRHAATLALPGGGVGGGPKPGRISFSVKLGVAPADVRLSTGDRL